MADQNNPDDEHAAGLARERTLARLMEAAAVLAAARIAPGDRNEDVETIYQCSLSMVINEYWRMIGYGFTDDPAKAATDYVIGMEGTARFAPS